jgi:hypothetical protein
MYAADVAIKAALQSAGITFPGPLVGMFGVVVALLTVGNQTAEKILAWFGPSLQWIAKWLPLFYVASLVTLPLNLSGIAGALQMCKGMRVSEGRNCSRVTGLQERDQLYV